MMMREGDHRAVSRDNDLSLGAEGGKKARASRKEKVAPVDVVAVVGTKKGWEL